MNSTLHPNENYLIISLNDLETAWTMLAAPHKIQHIPDTLKIVKELNRVRGPEKAIFTIISATAWLTSDLEVTDGGFGSQGG